MSPGVSLEYISEFYSSYMYWDAFRYLFICKDITFGQFLFSKGIHILIELLNNLGRVSSIYLSFTTYLSESDSCFSVGKLFARFLSSFALLSQVSSTPPLFCLVFLRGDGAASSHN